MNNQQRPSNRVSGYYPARRAPLSNYPGNQGHHPQQYPPQQSQPYPLQQSQLYAPQQSQVYPALQSQPYPPQQSQPYPPLQTQQYAPQQPYPSQQTQQYAVYEQTQIYAVPSQHVRAPQPSTAYGPSNGQHPSYYQPPPRPSYQIPSAGYNQSYPQQAYAQPYVRPQQYYPSYGGPQVNRHSTYPSPNFYSQQQLQYQQPTTVHNSQGYYSARTSSTSSVTQGQRYPSQYQQYNPDSISQDSMPVPESPLSSGNMGIPDRGATSPTNGTYQFNNAPQQIIMNAPPQLNPQNMSIPSRGSSQIPRKQYAPPAAIAPRTDSGHYGRQSPRFNSKMFRGEILNAASVTIPFRSASIASTINPDTLLNSGTAAVTHPKFNIHEAFEKWTMAKNSYEKDQDLIGKAKCMSNISCLLKTQGRCKEALAYVKEAWNLTTEYVKNAASTGKGSKWLQLAITALEISGPEIDNAYVTSSTSPIENGKNKEYSKGPPIVMWLLQLTNNIGNIHYSMGEYEYAIRCYDTCLTLVETTLEEFPLPKELIPIASAAKPTAPNVPPSIYGAKTSYRLSSLHKQIVLSLARSLSHLGMCYGALGAATTNLQYQLAAYTFITNMAAKVPSLLNSSTFGARTSSISGASHDISDFVILQTMITANVGAAWYGTGDIGKSIEWNEKSARKFANTLPTKESKEVENRNVGLEEARQIANLAATYIHIGSCIKAMQWCGIMTATETEPSTWKTPIDEFNLLGGPSNLEKPASIQVMDRALSSFYQQANRQHCLQDRFGLTVTLLNIATSYAQMNRPFLALHYISKAVASPEDNNSVQFRMPRWLNAKALNLLCQVLFSICLIEIEKPGVGVGPYIQKCGGSRISKFLSNLDIPFNKNLSNLSPTLVIELFEYTAHVYREILKIKSDGWVSSLLMKSENALYPAAPANQSKSLSPRVESKIVYPTPRETYPTSICTIKASLSSIHLMICKLAWIAASKMGPTHQSLFSVGLDALKYVIFGLRFDNASFPMLNVPETVDISKAMQQGINNFLIKTVAEHYESQEAVQPHVGSSYIAGYLTYSVFPFVTYLVAVTSQLNTPGSNEIVKMLDVTSNIDVVQKVEDTFIDVCRTIVQKNLDMCGECFDNMMTRYEAHDDQFKASLPSHGKSDMNCQQVPCIHGCV